MVVGAGRRARWDVGERPGCRQHPERIVVNRSILDGPRSSRLQWNSLGFIANRKLRSCARHERLIARLCILPAAVRGHPFLFARFPSQTKDKQSTRAVAYRQQLGTYLEQAMLDCR